MTESFSKKVKAQLAQIEIKKKCCRFTLDSLTPIAEKKCGNGESSAPLLRTAWEKCRCDSCKNVWLRSLFNAYGSITNPEKGYHCDFTFKFEDECDVAQEILPEFGLDFRRTKRKEKHVLYIKGSAVIEDLLISIGAQSAAFDFMNSKIVHEFRGSVNRQVNCDTANIEKQLASVKKYIEAIDYLNESGRIDALSEELRLTARLRRENDQLSLGELAKMFNPPVSKSGLRHRLDKILTVSRELSGKTGEE